MIRLIGFNDETQEYKLLNTAMPISQAVRTCSYAFHDSLFGRDGDTKTEEQELLSEQLHQLRRSCNKQGTQGEYRILYYSCDYSETNMLLRNIRVHLVDGSILKLKEALNKAELYSASEQLQVTFLFDCLAYNEDGVIELHNIYIFEQSLLYSLDESVALGLSYITYTYPFLINGTNQLLPLVRGTFPLIANGTKRPRNFAVPSISTDKPMAIIFSLGLPSLNVESGAVEEDGPSNSVYTPYRRNDKHYSVLKSTLVILQSGYISKNTKRMGMTERLLETKLIHRKDALSLLMDRNDSVAMQAIDGFEYLITSGMANPYSIQLAQGVLNGKALWETMQDSLAPMLDTLRIYQEQETVLIVENGVLKAVIAPEDGKATVDLKGIKAIDDHVLEELEQLHITCSGEFELEKQGKQGIAFQSQGTTYSTDELASRLLWTN